MCALAFLSDAFGGRRPPLQQHAFDGTKPVPPIILVSAVTGRWRRKFVL